MLFLAMVYLLAGSVVWSGLGSWVREFPPSVVLAILVLCWSRVPLAGWYL